MTSRRSTSSSWTVRSPTRSFGRRCRSRSTARSLFTQIYEPILTAAGIDGALLNCGAWTPGPFCPEGIFESTYDPIGAEELLTGDGWTRNDEGLWEKDGEVPEIRWMIDDGNLRRETTQATLIPLLRDAGFNVVADNGTADEVFEQRLPTLDYDMAMFIRSPTPDPGELTSVWACDQIPTEENNFQGQNHSGWCNEEATAALHEADMTVDPEARAELVMDGAVADGDRSRPAPVGAVPDVGRLARRQGRRPGRRRGRQLGPSRTSATGRTSTVTARS